MKLFYFFRANEKGQPTYGQNYCVIAKDLRAAQKAVISSKDWKDQGDIMSRMAVKVYGENEVIHTETS